MLNLIPFAFPGVAHVRCAFQARSLPCPEPQAPPRPESLAREGNISFDILPPGADPAPTAANRAALITALAPLGMRAFAECKQVHGVRTVFEPLPQAVDQPAAEEADGMAASQPGLGLMIKTADCQPLLLTHRERPLILALHVGWKGNRQEYPGLAVEEFCARYDVLPRDLAAVRGPSLGPGAAQFVHFDAEWGEAYAPWFDAAEATMDLWRLTRDQLCRAGLSPRHIHGLDLCTHALAREFFSYRVNRACGRQASLIWIR